MIETKRMKLRKATEDDVEAIQTWWNDGELMESVGFPNGLGITEENVRKQLNRENHVLMIALDIENDTLIGEFSYGQIDPEDGTARIGLKIANRDYQGKGYGKEGLKYLLGYLFEYYALDAVLVDTFVSNDRARGLYEKFGAKVERIEGDYWTNPDGKSFDVVFYRITRESFEEALNQL